MKKPNGITLELLSVTALRLAALKSKEPHGMVGLVEEAYCFLELCEDTLEAKQENRRIREEFQRKAATEGIPTSEALKQIARSNGSYYRKRFFEFLKNDGLFRSYAEDFKKTIPRDLIPDLKRRYQEWNNYQRDLENTKKALKAREPNEEAKKLIDKVQMFSQLPHASRKSSKKSS
jgi:hypothetical protein